MSLGHFCSSSGVWLAQGWDGKGEEGAEPLVQLCQPRTCVTSVPSLSSGQQHPVIPWYLGGDGVSTQPWPYGPQRAGEYGAGGDQLSQDWEGLLPHISLFEQLSEPVLGLSYIQAAG